MSAPDRFHAVTITLNPAIDRTVSLREFNAGTVNRVESASDSPGGKGVNVAVALASDGLRVAVAGFLGEENTEPFDKLFAKTNISDRFTRLAGRTRIAIKVVDQTRAETTEINFPGLAPTAADLAQFHLHLSSVDAGWAVLGGSLPPGIDPAFYRTLIHDLKARGIKVALDTSGEALAAALPAGPAFIKPNLAELVALVGRPLSLHSEIAAAARSLLDQGTAMVAVSMGSEGAIFVDRQQTFLARGPALRAASAVGAGDALVAGLVVAQIRGLSLAESARLASGYALRAVKTSQLPSPSITAESCAELVTVSPA